MILLTRLSGNEFVLNSDLIERIDKTPDTVITLTDGSKYVVAESLAAVVAEIRLHRAEIIALSDSVRVSPHVVPSRDEDWDDDPAQPATLASVTPHPRLAPVLRNSEGDR